MFFSGFDLNCTVITYHYTVQNVVTVTTIITDATVITVTPVHAEVKADVARLGEGHAEQCNHELTLTRNSCHNFGKCSQ